MAELKPGDIQKVDVKPAEQPEVKGVPQVPLQPLLIPDEIVRKGKEQQLADAELDWRIAHPGIAWIASNWWKFLSGGAGAAALLKLSGC